MATTIELYSAALQNNEPAFYARIPQIIHYCTYIAIVKGKRIRKRLSAYAIAAYLYVKQIAGQTNACWMSGENLADGAGMSEGMFSKVKKLELTVEIEQLGNQSLFTIEKRKRRISQADGSFKVIVYDHIIVNDIWKYNNAYMATKKQMEPLPLGFVDNSDYEVIDPVHNSPSSSQCESVEISSSQYEGDSHRSSSQYEPNNRTEEDSYCYKADTVASATCDCSQIKGETVNSVREELFNLGFECQRKMKLYGCDDKFINEMTRRFDPQRILDAVYYTERQLARGNVHKNPYGYLRLAIENNVKWINKGL